MVKQRESGTRRPHASKTLMLLSLMMTVFITPFMGSSVNLMIPGISKEFRAGAVSVEWVLTAYILLSAVLAVPFGRLADLRKKKTILLTGQFLFAAAAFFCVFAWNIQGMILGRAVQGIGAAMIFATLTAILVGAFPPEKRGQMLGFSVSFTYLGLSLGPVLGGLLNHYLGWRPVFLIAGIYGTVVWILALLFVEEPAPAPRAGASAGQELQSGSPSEETRIPMDRTGCILYSASLGMIIYGFSAFMGSLAARILLVAGILLLCVFIRHERKEPHPVIDVELVRKNRTFALSNLAALLNYGSNYAVTCMLSIYLQNVRGFSSRTAGLILIASPLMMTLLSSTAGKLSDRFSPFRLASAGMAVTGLGIFALIFTTENLPVPLLVLILVVIGTGVAIFSSPNANAIMSSVEPQRYGIASSFMSTSRNIGQSVSLAIVSSVIAATVGNVPLDEAPASAIVLSIRISYILFTILCVAGIWCSIRRTEKDSVK